MTVLRAAVPPRFARCLAIAVLCVLVTACGQESRAQAAPPRDASFVAPAASLQAVARSGQAMWENGMAYATLRSRLISRGWVPLPDAQCRASVAGDNHVTLCAADPQQCEPCKTLPELSICSGTGHCTMHFRGDGGKTLSVSTYGDVQRRSETGEPEDLVVTAVEPAIF